MKEVEWTPEYNDDCVFYDDDGHETLRYDSIDEYMFDFACEHDDVSGMLAENCIITVFGYKRMMPDKRECEFLDDLIERIDEERGEPGGDHRPIDDYDMKELERLESEFIDKLLSVYTPWACEKVVAIQVPFRDWFEQQSDGDKEIMLNTEEQ